MIYDYITTKPPLDEDTLAHYGIKGMKWKNHIYAVKKALTNGYGQARNRVLTMLPQLQNRLNAGISTARKKANAAYASGSKKASSMYSTARKKAKGSYYRGKSKTQELGAKVNRKIRKIDLTRRTTDGGKIKTPSRDTGKVGYNPIGNEKYLFGYQRNKKVNKRNLDAGIAAGRKRAAKKRR